MQSMPLHSVPAPFLPPNSRIDQRHHANNLAIHLPLATDSKADGGDEEDEEQTPVVVVEKAKVSSDKVLGRLETELKTHEHRAEQNAVDPDEHVHGEASDLRERENASCDDQDRIDKVDRSRDPDPCLATESSDAVGVGEGYRRRVVRERVRVRKGGRAEGQKGEGRSSASCLLIPKTVRNSVRYHTRYRSTVPANTSCRSPYETHLSDAAL